MSLNDATTPLIEGMLRAIVADDPFALWEVAEEWALRHERLSVLYGYFALLGVVGVVLGWTATALSDVDESEVAFVAH